MEEMDFDFDLDMEEDEGVVANGGYDADNRADLHDEDDGDFSLGADLDKTAGNDAKDLSFDEDNKSSEESDVDMDADPYVPPNEEIPSAAPGDQEDEDEEEYLGYDNDAGDMKENLFAAPENQKDEDEKEYLGDGNDEGGMPEGQTTRRASRLFPIEVVLFPVSNPQQYERLPPSWDVEHILDEIEADGDTWYRVEFQDGRVDELSFDDVVTCHNGSAALRRHRDQQFGHQHASMDSHAKKRARADFDFSDGEDSDDSDISARPRRSTRQRTTPRYQSAFGEPEFGLDREVDGWDLFEEDKGRPTRRQAKKDDDDDDPFGSPQEPRNERGRSLRSKNRPSQKPVYTDKNISEDELAKDPSSGDEDAFVPIVSDLAPPKRSSARKKKSRTNYNHFQSRSHDRDSSIEFETNNRRSGRSNRNTKSMKVPDEAEDYEAIEKESAVPRHVSVKEIFQALPEDSEFERFHCPTCETCGGEAHTGKGPLICCQGCSYSYHKVCLGLRAARDHRVTKIGADSFVLQCRLCIGIHRKRDENAPNHAMCQTCKVDGSSCAEFSTKKTGKQEEKLRQENDGVDPITEVSPELVNNSRNVLFRCSGCKRGYHFEHLPPPTRNADMSEDVRSERLEEYAMLQWRCKDCVDAAKIHALVAWRPVDEGAAGQTCDDVPEDQKQYLVKWEKRSHWHDTWMPGAWVFGATASSMRSAFNKRDSSKLPKMNTKDAVEEEWLMPDVILKVKYGRKNTKAYSKKQDLERISDVAEIFVKFQGLSYMETVWDSPPPEDSGAPWEAFCAAYDEYVNGVYFETIPNRKVAERIKEYRQLDFTTQCFLESQPAGLRRGKLMEYQIEGVNWLLHRFHRGENAVLADEMGLGKTVQVVALITTLIQEKPKCWPFLIVVPNATCSNWRRELKGWSPDLRVVTYHGGKGPQDLAYRWELFPEGPAGGMKAHVVIMSYEAAVDTKFHFRNVKWAGLIVDEGQRLKNERSLLYVALQEMKIPFRVLLTGTPLQNNKRELFNLLQFIDEKHVAEKLDLEYAELTKETIPKLHQLIRPYFLRRTKLQVLKFLPPMAQIILPVSMSVLQEKLSKTIIARNPDLLKAIISNTKSKVKAGERKSLNNMLMDLRQVLCHPFVFSSTIEDRSISDPAKVHQNLVEASGKLVLLNIMLLKLKARGHRVLIFSQFLESLTILEDFLTALGLEHARIDGSNSAMEKQKKIDAFNAPDSPLFAMLLSTRAGGVGINLATADTVIIFDPDFNPHQDIQALSRAHRIGQKDKVLCFQLMTKDTVEEKIMQVGRKKMALDHALIESLDDDDAAGDDLESILKHGAAALFGDEDNKNRIVHNDASVEKLIDRSQMENTNAGEDQSAETQFSFAKVWSNDSATLNANGLDDEATPADMSVWENILKLREEEHRLEEAQKQRVYGRGARRTGTQGVRYDPVGTFVVEDANIELNPKQTLAHDGDSEGEGDELYVDPNDVEEDSDKDDGDDEDAVGDLLPSSKRGKGTKRRAPPTTPSRPTKKAKTINTTSPKRGAKAKPPARGQSTPRKKSNPTAQPTSVGESPSAARSTARAKPVSTAKSAPGTKPAANAIPMAKPASGAGIAPPQREAAEDRTATSTAVNAVPNSSAGKPDAGSATEDAAALSTDTTGPGSGNRVVPAVC